MAYKVIIKCTDKSGVGVYLHNKTFADPKPLPKAKTDAGAQPSLDPGNYSVHVIAEHLEADTDITVSVMRNDDMVSCPAKSDDRGNLYLICYFELTDDGKVQ